MNIEKKAYSIELKDLKKTDDNSGTFEGYANVTEFKDSGGDIIHKDAFAATLKRRSTLPLLHLHDIGQTIGSVKLAEDDKGLRVTLGELNLNKKSAQDVYEDMTFFKKRKLPMEMSIGFHLVKNKWEWDEKTSTRHIYEVNLKEVSIVPPGFAMNSRSRVTAVKSDTEDEIRRRVDEIERAIGDIKNEKKLEKLIDDVKILKERLDDLADRQPEPTEASPEPQDRHSGDDLQKVSNNDPQSPSLVAEPEMLNMLSEKLREIIGDHDA